MIDQLAGLNRMSLPFTYLVLANSDRSIEEILPGLKKAPVDQTARLVSPVHKEGKDLEFFICTKTGKKRARYRPGEDEELERGTILQGLDFRGDENSTRIEGFVDKLG
jgi:hypothetical protein